MVWIWIEIENCPKYKYSIVTKWFVFELKSALLVQLSGCRLANNKMDRILKPDSIEWFIEDKAFLLLALPPPPSLSPQQTVSLSQSFWVSQVQLTSVGWEEGGVSLYKSFNTLWLKPLLQYNTVYITVDSVYSNGRE